MSEGRFTATVRLVNHDLADIDAHGKNADLCTDHCAGEKLYAVGAFELTRSSRCRFRGGINFLIRESLRLQEIIVASGQLNRLLHHLVRVGLSAE